MNRVRRGSRLVAVGRAFSSQSRHGSTEPGFPRGRLAQTGARHSDGGSSG
jgi:hypothetical protein